MKKLHFCFLDGHIPARRIVNWCYVLISGRFILSLCCLIACIITNAQNTFPVTARAALKTNNADLSPSANTSLSNLNIATAINHTLQPGSTGKISLGSPAKQWRNLYLSGNLTSDSASIDNFSSKIARVDYLKTTSERTGYIESDGAHIWNGLLVFGLGIYSSNDSKGGTGLTATGDSAGVQGYSVKDGVAGYSPNWVGVRGISDGYPGTGVLAHGGWEGVFATGDYVGIKATGYNDAGVIGISFGGYGGHFSSDSNWALLAETSSGAYAGVFYGDVYTSGSYMPSDKNLKQDIRDFSSAMVIINKLKPKYYKYKEDAKYAFLHLPEGDHYGLLAQDLEEVLPGLVKKSAHKITGKDDKTAISSAATKPDFKEEFAKQRGAATAAKENLPIKAVNYLELIPILVKGMQEQQIEIEELKADKDKKITSLQRQLDELKAILLSGNSNTTAISAAGYLKQNLPNPANDNTVISYYVPASSGSVQISLTDIKGSEVKVYKVKAGEGLLKIRSGELPAGTYTYSLYLNDKRIDSKQMVITR